MAELTPQQEDNRTILNAWLGNFKLGSLGDTVVNWIIQGYSPDRIKLEITNTNEFKQEFPEYEVAIQKGTPMTPGEILSYRDTVTQLFRDYNLPTGFYDQKEDFVDLISKGLSGPELVTRIEQGYTRVAGAPQEVKDVFNEYFGVKGDAMLATFYLDPARGGKFLADAATQAEIGGAASQYGFDFNQAEAQRYQQLGISGGQARESLRQASGMKSLVEESISESTDITSDQLAEAALTGGTQEERITRRQQERRAAFGGGSGGASQGREGLGLGAAR